MESAEKVCMSIDLGSDLAAREREKAFCTLAGVSPLAGTAGMLDLAGFSEHAADCENEGG